MKVALYSRVSTSEQTTEPQRLELLEYCGRRGWTDLCEYADRASGAKVTRIGLEAMMAAVRKGKIGVVCCVKLDRLGRSLPHLAQLFAEFESNKVALISTSQGIDTTNDNPCGRLIMGVLSAIADFELSLIKDRTNAGLKAARARGAKFGRPRFTVGLKEKEIIAAWRAVPDATYFQLATALGCSVGTAHALVKEDA